MPTRIYSPVFQLHFPVETRVGVAPDVPVHAPHHTDYVLRSCWCSRRRKAYRPSTRNKHLPVWHLRPMSRLAPLSTQEAEPYSSSKEHLNPMLAAQLRLPFLGQVRG